MRIKLTNLGKRYNREWIFRNLNFQFEPGKHYAITGPNGSGKSTLLKIIAGTESSFLGDVVFSPGYTVGYLEQDPQLDESKTVKEIVQEGAQEIVDVLKAFERYQS